MEVEMDSPISGRDAHPYGRRRKGARIKGAVALLKPKICAVTFISIQKYKFNRTIIKKALVFTHL